MNAFDLIYSFRVRLLLVLATLLVATLGVQYYLNQRAERSNTRIIAEQEKALAAGTALGVNSISTKEYLYELRDRAKQPLLDEKTGRIIDILVVDNNWRVLDSLNVPEYRPTQAADGTIEKRPFREVELPPIIIADQIADDRAHLPPKTATAPQSRTASEPRAFFFPVETEKGRWHVIVILGSTNAPTGFLQIARPLLYTLAVLLVATLFAGFLVWRFTKPIKDLADAARRVAAGDLDFRVPAADRRDEMGALAARFNEMIAGLGRTRLLETRLNQAERSAVVGRLASAIAHEVRNPLNYINLTLDHLRTAFAPADEQKRQTFDRLAAQLKTEVARINTRISEFLNYTRPPKLDMQTLDLRAVAEDALRMVEVTAAESNIKTSVETEGTVPQVLGDAESLRSVFTNLVINGLQAIDGEGGSLSIKLSPDETGKRARVDITDTGCGIASEHIAQVFEPYFSTKETGTGLGLAIVKKAVTDHGGTIAVSSKPDHGTTFTITLPASKEMSNSRG